MLLENSTIADVTPGEMERTGASEVVVPLFPEVGVPPLLVPDAVVPQATLVGFELPAELNARTI